MIRKNLLKSLSVIMAAMMAIMTVACGANTVDTSADTAVTETVEDKEEDTLASTVVSASNIASAESEAGKVETVYVTADANGAVNDVIVSEWLKNAAASPEIADTTQLKDIVNVKGDETFKDNGDGTLTWNAAGSDIYYQGTTDKQLPVTMKITYTLDGKEITPEELAGKSGRVTIRFEYENNDRQTVEVNGKEVDVYTPFAMVSGMMLDSDKFTNVEISNGKVISDGGNIIVMGVALPGLKESLDISDDKWDELEDADEIKDRLSNSFEITADTTDFELGMTITMASSDILSDFGMTDLSGSDKLDDLKSDMEDLNDGSNKLVDGTKELKDGTKEFADGTKKLYDGTKELKDGTSTLKDGAGALYEGTGSLYDGVVSYTDGVSKVNDGVSKLKDGASSAKEGADKLAAGAKTAKESADKLATGSMQLKDGVLTVADSLATVRDSAAAGAAAFSWLTGNDPCSEQMLGILYTLSGEKITSAAMAESVRSVGQTYMSSSSTTSVTPADNGAEPELDADFGTVSLDDADPDKTKDIEPVQDNIQDPEKTDNDENKKAETPVNIEPSNELPKVQDDESKENTDVDEEEEQLGENTKVLLELDPDNSEEVEVEGLLGAKKVVTASANRTANLLGAGNPAADIPSIIMYNQLLGAAKALSQAYNGDGTETNPGLKVYTDIQKDTIKAGITQIADGNTALAAGLGELSGGISTLDSGLGTLSSGVGELKNGTGTLVSNNDKLVDGAYKLSDGARQLYDGSSKLNDGAGELYDGVGELNDGAIKLDDGVKELLDGITKFDEEGIKKIYEAFDGDLSDFTDRLEAIKEAGSNYKTFGGSADDVDSSVKFIIKTDSIKSL